MKFKRLIVCQDETIVRTNVLAKILDYLGEDWYDLPEDISGALGYLTETIIIQERNWNEAC